MNLLQLRKWKELLFVCIGVLSFCACSEDEEWDITELEVTTSNLDIPYTGGSHTFSFKTNNKWTISCKDEWVSFDKTSGTGDATITATFENNPADYTRKSYIQLTSGEDPTSNNVVGVKNLTVSALQHSLYQDKLDAIKVEVKNVYCTKKSIYTSYDRQTYYYYTVKAGIRIVSEDLNMDETIKEVGVTIYMDGRRNEWSTHKINATKSQTGDYMINLEDQYHSSSYSKVEIIPYVKYILPNGNIQTNYYEKMLVTLTNI